MRDDALTVAAIAVLAMCVATAAHEAAGHGSACLLAGGRITQLTSVYFQCAGQSRFIAIAGPIGNLVAAALSIYWAAGYLVEAMAINHGDYVFAGEDFLGQPSTWWRAVGIVLGVAIYLVSGRALVREAAALSAGAGGCCDWCCWPRALPRSWRPRSTRPAGVLEIAAAAFPLLFIGNRVPENPDAPPIARSPTGSLWAFSFSWPSPQRWGAGLPKPRWVPQRPPPVNGSGRHGKSRVR